jgi:hypothetical protein
MLATGSLTRVDRQSSEELILSEQLKLLYANANLGVAVNVLAATILAGLQWGIVSQAVVIGWWLYITLVSSARFALARRYWHAASGPEDITRWRNLFITGVAFAGAGWGGAGVLLYPPAHLNNQVFLIFVLGGMMLGASSVLAPRPEAFLAFLLPVGMIPAVRFFLQAGKNSRRYGTAGGRLHPCYPGHHPPNLPAGGLLAPAADREP